MRMVETLSLHAAMGFTPGCATSDSKAPDCGDWLTFGRGDVGSIRMC